MSTVIDRLLAANPLLAHGPRSHGTGIAVTSGSAPIDGMSVQAPTTWRSFLLAESVAPSTHMGPVAL